MTLPTIQILLATYNGERYLRQQWASLEAQRGVRLVVHVGDDGSSDGTVALVRELEAKRSGAVVAVRWLQAPPRRSAARNFLMLLESAVRSGPDAEWFAYCDQDDVWLPGKLAAALEVLAPYAGAATPALYGSRTIAVDEEDREHGLSPLFQRAPSFRNALTQNITGANTMLMNRAAATLVARSAQTGVVWHDWITYQLVSGAGGFVHYDARPWLRYRQHGGNVMGSNLRLRARWDRLAAMLRGEYAEWNRLNVAALRQHVGALSAESRGVLEAFIRAREAPHAWARLAWLYRSGVFRQKRAEQLLLWLACLLRRL